MVRGVRETVTSAISVAVLITALVWFDPRVRDKFWGVVADPGGAMLSPLGSRVGDLGNVLWTAARDQSIENAPFVIFGVVGIALMVFMLRS
jgi:hypothetical protein